MIVTLKKAHALALALGQIKTPIPLKVSVSIHASKLPDFGAAHEKLREIQQQIAARIDAQYVIRALVSTANEGTINALVTERACIDRQLEVLNGLPQVTKFPDADEIQAQITANKSSTYGGSSTITVELPTDFVLPTIKSLKQRRIKCEDELARLNFSTTVELPEHVVEVLRTYDLV